jgi:5-methylcytosine-specific restriction endonuclease McrA
MTDAEAWRWRYNNDHVFRQKEIQRLKTAKLKRKKQQGHALSKDEALAIYAERSTCLYCGCALEDGDKVLDHMDPLSKGGAHDASNLVVSCTACNTRKASKEFVKWLPLVAESRRRLVADWYKRKHGALPEQANLLLLVAA